MRTSTPGVLWTIHLLCTTVWSQSLPYNPTTILLPETSSPNRSIAYIFRPQGSSVQHELVSLNISSTISSADLAFNTLTTTLPFQHGESDAFIPSISSAGDISVFTGSCSSTTSELWRFMPDGTSMIGNGTWKRQTTHGGRDVATTSLAGAGFLSRAFSFSTYVPAKASQTNLYVFGGMCPSSEATESTWQSAATYSNTMRRLAPSSDNEYTMGLPTSRGPPIAEAGFTMTGLTPTSSNSSGALMQQQNFVLLGGHTQTAFINMSQVAIWSMPEESWSFVTVSSSYGSNVNIELAIKSTVPSIDSRSGHTTVLSEDGASLIVYGGWVGEVGQAADPQLVVLSLGAGFGGDGDWQWVVPAAQPTGAAIYGHGAVMLPGNVMMILGGHEISGGNTKRSTSKIFNLKRQASVSQARFWNATSMNFIQNYTNPNYVASLGTQNTKGSSGSNAKKVGLGAGLGLGLAAVISAIAVFCWYNRRLKRRRTIREKDLNALSVASATHYTPRRMEERESGGFPWAHGGWNNRSQDRIEPMYDSNSAVAGYENLQSGVHGAGYNGAYPPPPKQIARKPLHSRNARGVYQPTPNYDFNAANAHGRTNSLGTAGPIHPIYEADEEEQSRKSADGAGRVAVNPESSDQKRKSDPFRDPHQSQPVQMPFRRPSLAETETSHRSREREIQEWVQDWAAAETLMNSQMRSHSNAGRISPTRRAQIIAASTISSMSGEEDSGRTASNLSEGSVAISAMSISRSGSDSQGRSRSNSLRGFITNAMSPFSAAATTSTAPSTILTATAFDSRLQPPLPKSSGSTSSSFTTAHTSFTALQAEGENLLPRPDDVNSGQNSPTRSQQDAPGSPSKSKASGLGKGRGGSSWLGSIRRAIIGESEDAHDFHSVPSRDPSPIRVDYVQGPEPRRTVSAGATLWRRKQGKSDWEDSAVESSIGQSSRSNTFTGDIGGSSGRASGLGMTIDDDEEWDVEQAVQNRVVQVMFTVPKEKLRVVNHDVSDNMSMSDIASLRSRHGSGKSTTDVGASLESVVVGVPPSNLPPPPPPPAAAAASPEVTMKKGKFIQAVAEEPEVEVRMPRSAYKGKGKDKEREVDLVREIEREIQREFDAEREIAMSAQRGSEKMKPLRRPKSRVLEMVEDMEKRATTP